MKTKNQKLFFVGLSIMLLLIISASFNIHQQVKANSPTLLFGIGTEANTVINDPLVQQAPVKMLTSWYNSPSDLSWMSGLHSGFVPSAYAKGYALHLIVYSGDTEGNVTTKYGGACGRAYPLSSGFISDMQKLATIFSGSGPLYVTMLTEFQTYPCTDNQWQGNENYFNALKDQYTAAKNIFHQYAPNSYVSLGWGGWQSRFDNPQAGGGKSLIPHFADVMNVSDFQSFQSMENDTNVNDITAMSQLLHNYGNGLVMVAHYKPNNSSQTVFDTDTRAIFTNSYIQTLTSQGVFAFSFMDNTNINTSQTTFSFIKNAITTYAASWIIPPGLSHGITGSSNSTKLAITICPHGFGNCGDNLNQQSPGNNTPQHPSRTAAVTIFDAQNNLVTKNTSVSITFDESSHTFTGIADMGNLASGTYLIQIGMNGYLTKQTAGITTITATQTTTLPAVSLTAGDINNDNQIDVQDYNLLVSCYGSRFTTSSCLSTQSDLNDDDAVNGVDYNLFLRELTTQKGA